MICLCVCAGGERLRSDYARYAPLILPLLETYAQFFAFFLFFFFLSVLDTGNERKFASLCWRNLFVGALIRRIAPRAERAKFLPRDRLLFAASCIQKPALLKRRLRRKKKKGEINAVCLIGDWFYSGAKISQLGGSVIT